MTNDEGISKPKSRITSRYCGRGWPANQGVENEHPWFSNRENCGEDQWYNASGLCVEKSLPTTAPRLSPGGRFRAAKSPGPAVQFEMANPLHRRRARRRSCCQARKALPKYGKQRRTKNDFQRHPIPHSSTNGCDRPCQPASQFGRRPVDLQCAATEAANLMATFHLIALRLRSKNIPTLARNREFDARNDRRSKQTPGEANHNQ